MVSTYYYSKNNTSRDTWAEESCTLKKKNCFCGLLDVTFQRQKKHWCVANTTKLNGNEPKQYNCI